jgi:5-methylcytosine-specific restriction endonuclease McrA
MKDKDCEKRADAAFWRLVIMRGRCQRCGSSHQLECHHIVRRAVKAARWVTDLSLCLCSECHRTGEHAAHADPAGFWKWLEKQFPEKYELAQKYLYRPDWERLDTNQTASMLEARLWRMAI